MRRVAPIRISSLGKLYFCTAVKVIEVEITTLMRGKDHASPFSIIQIMDQIIYGSFNRTFAHSIFCLLYTSDAADE